jgi:hypothetical protein
MGLTMAQPAHRRKGTSGRTWTLAEKLAFLLNWASFSRLCHKTDFLPLALKRLNCDYDGNFS